MKRNDTKINRVYSFFNAIRGNNTPSEYQSVLAVLKKVMVLQECAQNEMDYDELYELMISVAKDFEISNPFPDKERFFDIYRTLQGFDESGRKKIRGSRYSGCGRCGDANATRLPDRRTKRRIRTAGIRDL